MVDVARDLKVTAVVVTYNRKALLKECLDALLDSDFKSFDILIVDNASTDGTAEHISEYLANPRIKYLNTGENIGGAGGFNLGIKEAMKASSDYIWLMDDDCIVGKDSLSALLKFADGLNGKFGYLSSVVKWTDGSICNMNVQRVSIAKSVTDFKKSQRIKMASFVSMLLSAQAVSDCGLPIKEFFIWGDDMEYSSRISRKFDCYLVPESTVTHKSAENYGSDISADRYDRIGRYFYAYRNEKYYYGRLGIKGKIYFFLKITYHRFRLLLSAVDHKKERFAVIRKALKADFNPSIEFCEKDEN